MAGRQFTVIQTDAISIGDALYARSRPGLRLAPRFGMGRRSVSHDGVDALRSGKILDEQYSYVQTTITGPGRLTEPPAVTSESKL